MSRRLALLIVFSLSSSTGLRAQQLPMSEGKSPCKACVPPAVVHRALIDMRHDQQLQFLLRRIDGISRTKKSQINQTRSRIRQAAWLPDLTLSASRGIRDSGRYNSDVTPYAYFSDALVLRASLHFSLPKLIASSSETYWHSQHEALDKASMHTKERIIELYYQRQALLLERKLLNETSPEKELRRRSLEDQIYLLTGTRL